MTVQRADIGHSSRRNGMIDTYTTITLRDNKVVCVTTPAPGFYSWGPVPADEMRVWVDILLKSTPLKRNGTRRAVGHATGWTYFYDVTPR